MLAPAAPHTMDLAGRVIPGPVGRNTTALGAERTRAQAEQDTTARVVQPTMARAAPPTQVPADLVTTGLEALAIQVQEAPGDHARRFAASSRHASPSLESCVLSMHDQQVNADSNRYPPMQCERFE